MSSEQLHELVCTAAGITNVVTKHGFCCLMAEAKCTTDWVICSQVFTCLGDGIRQEFLPSAVTLHRGQLLACPRLLTGFRPWSSPPLGWPLRFMAICCRVSEVAIAARVVVVMAGAWWPALPMMHLAELRSSLLPWMLRGWGTRPIPYGPWWW